MLCSAGSDLGLHCLHMSHKKDTMLIWVNFKFIMPSAMSLYFQSSYVVYVYVLLFRFF